MGKQAPSLFDQLGKALAGGEGEDLVKKTKVTSPRHFFGLRRREPVNSRNQGTCDSRPACVTVSSIVVCARCAQCRSCEQLPRYC